MTPTKLHVKNQRIEKNVNWHDDLLLTNYPKNIGIDFLLSHVVRLEEFEIIDTVLAKLEIIDFKHKLSIIRNSKPEAILSESINSTISDIDHIFIILINIIELQQNVMQQSPTSCSAKSLEIDYNSMIFRLVSILKELIDTLIH